MRQDHRGSRPRRAVLPAGVLTLLAPLVPLAAHAETRPPAAHAGAVGHAVSVRHAAVAVHRAVSVRHAPAAVRHSAAVHGAASAASPAPAPAPTGGGSAPGGTGGAQCGVQLSAGTATAVCHNPDPDVTRVRLHVLCARWWDPATDTAPALDGPAQWLTLTGHCWKEIRAAWVTREAAG